MRMVSGYGIACLLLAGSLGAQAFDLERAAVESGVSRDVLKAIALQESRIQDPEIGKAKPWPWVLGTEEGSYWYGSRNAAEKALKTLLDKGVRNIDVGAFQVNLRWNGDLVERAEDLLDPGINLWAAVQVLAECRQRFGDRLARILSCYHAGHPDKRHGVRYAENVLTIAERLKE